MSHVAFEAITRGNERIWQVASLTSNAFRHTPREATYARPKALFPCYRILDGLPDRLTLWDINGNRVGGTVTTGRRR